MASLRLIAILLALHSIASAEQPFRGKVFLDKNNNGRLDKGEPGLPGIAITDGIQHVQTDRNGIYTLTLVPDPVLPRRRARTISISWPSQTWPTTPWWHRVADIQGQAVHFGLRPQKQTLPLTFAHATDPHNNCGGAISEQWHKEIASLRDRVQLCFITGDLGYMGIKNADRAFHEIRQYTDRFPVPMFHTVGNHDIVGIHTEKWNLPTDIHGNGAFTKYLGPIRWSFDYAGIHFIGLDWAHIEGKKLEPGGITKEAAKWLDQDLKQAKPGRAYLFIHSAYDKTNRLWPILARHKVRMVIAGHSHRNFQKKIQGIPYINTMNLHGPYKLITITDKSHYLVHRCMGCRGRKQPNGLPYHSRRSFGYPTTGVCRIPVPLLQEARRDRLTRLKDIKLQSNAQPLKPLPPAPRFELAFQWHPDPKARYGIRLHSGKKVLEISASGQQIQCGEITAHHGNKDTAHHHWSVTLEEGIVFVRANHHVAFQHPFEPTAPARIHLFAENGRATVPSLQHWTLKKQTKKYKN